MVMFYALGSLLDFGSIGFGGSYAITNDVITSVLHIALKVYLKQSLE